MKKMGATDPEPLVGSKVKKGKKRKREKEKRDLSIWERARLLYNTIRVCWIVRMLESESKEREKEKERN